MTECEDRVERQLRQYIQEEEEASIRLAREAEGLAERQSQVKASLSGLNRVLEFHLAKRAGRDGERTHASAELNGRPAESGSSTAEDTPADASRSPHHAEVELLQAILRQGRYACMSVPAAAVRFFLERDNREATLAEIFDSLARDGLEIGGKDPLSNLTATLHGDRRFETVRRATYRLRPGILASLRESGHQLRVKIEEVRPQ